MTWASGVLFGRSGKHFLCTNIAVGRQAGNDVKGFHICGCCEQWCLFSFY